MAGPAGNLARGWQIIRARINMDEPSPVGRVLGCEHTVSRRSPRSGKQVQVMEYNMQPFLEDCVGKYLDLAKKPASSLRKVPTPFLEDNEERSIGAPSRKVDDGAPFQTEVTAHRNRRLRRRATAPKMSVHWRTSQRECS